MRTLGIHSSNVYRLEKKGGAVSSEDSYIPNFDPQDLGEFYEICKQASGRHTKWRKNNFLLWLYPWKLDFLISPSNSSLIFNS